MAHLSYELDGQSSRADIAPEGMTVGRSDDADVTIGGDRLSRLHFRVYRRDNLWLVEDMGSRNGTALAGRGGERKLDANRTVTAEHGARILAGGIAFTVHIDGGGIANADNARLSIGALRDEIAKAIVGKREPIELLLAALLAGGHVLIEDLPGLGKTTLARALARGLHASFSRMQFTPDLLPADIIGTSVYHQNTGEFTWRPGPIFANIVLADEINRATPRTQSALLEAMSEGQVSADGVSRRLPEPFMVVATQNPIEHAGTYPLPESQLDRFMLRLALGYPEPDDERIILSSFAAQDAAELVQPVMEAVALAHVKSAVRQVRVDESIKDYILAIAGESRQHPRLIAGVSPRGSLALYRAAQAFALIRGREYVIPDDVKALAVPVLAHRVIERASLEGRTSGAPGQATIVRILDKVPVPV